ncbi:MAG: sirohydrochlorin cobaltochelatase [Selenomonadaceae bacterium]|nr:sirohydrochlorin cobaltochelatase [Selenomonadaceae bacterium]
MKSLKKALAVTLASMAIGGFGTVAQAAGYELNSEVKTATPALQQAAQIGVLKYTNPDEEMQAKANKDAIIVMSFGTTYADTREKTINATVEAIKAANPGKKVVTAFTSHIIIDRVAKNEGIKYPTPEEACEQLAAEGYTRVAMCSLDTFPGMEYAYKVAVFNQYKSLFKKASMATPLMYWMGQEEQTDEVAEFAEALKTQFPTLGKKDAVLVLAHGTVHPSNAYYSVLQYRLNDLKVGNAYVYTVEGWPNLETVIEELKAKKVQNVTLMPMMMVAGDHANNDMAGDEDDSHKVILQKEGFKVSTYIHGLGENEAVRNLYVKHAVEAVEALK